MTPDRLTLELESPFIASGFQENPWPPQAEPSHQVLKAAPGGGGSEASGLLWGEMWVSFRLSWVSTGWKLVSRFLTVLAFRVTNSGLPEVQGLKSSIFSLGPQDGIFWD